MNTYPAVCQGAAETGKHHEVGTYAIDVGSTKALDRVTEVECPFCNQFLQEAVVTGGPIRRVVKECSPDKRTCDGLTVAVPDTHKVLVCKGCRLTFTVLKEAYHVQDQGSGEASGQVVEA